MGERRANAVLLNGGRKIQTHLDSMDTKLAVTTASLRVVALVCKTGIHQESGKEVFECELVI